MGTAYVNQKALHSLPPVYQEVVEVAVDEVTLWMLAIYDNGNSAAPGSQRRQAPPLPHAGAGAGAGAVPVRRG